MTIIEKSPFQVFVASGHECPKCGKPMVHQDDEPDVGIIGAWVCSECDEAVADWKYEDGEPS